MSPGTIIPSAPVTETTRVARLALSLKQPWAALLASGRKTVEVRKWNTRFRGELLVHAAQIDDDRPEAWGHVDDDLLPLARKRGGVVGVGVLVEVRHYLRPDDFAADKAAHLNEDDWFDEGGLFGFRFDLCRAVPFVRAVGNVRLFSLDVDIAEAPEREATASRFDRLRRSLARRRPEGG